MEALLPVSQNVFVLEGDFGSDTDADQVLAGSSSAQGLGVAQLALPHTDVCTPPRPQSSALFTSPGTASDIASFSGSTSTRSSPQYLLPPRRRLVMKSHLKCAEKPITRRVTVDWGAKLLNLELAACVGGPMPRVLWQHFYKARGYWVCKWVREQPQGLFKSKASYKEIIQLAKQAFRRFNKDDKHNLRSGQHSQHQRR